MATAFVNREAFIACLVALQQYALLSVHLFDNNFTPNVDTVLADLNEASYDSYPSGGIVPTAPSIGSAGNQEAYSTIGVNFPAPIGDGPVDIYGFWLQFDTATSVPQILMAVAFAGGPITLTNGGVTLPLIIDFRALDVNNP